jgi:hypothetical protein
MIIAQEQALLKAEKQFGALVDSLRQASSAGERMDRVERGLFKELLELGHTLLSSFVAAQGDGDVGETTTTPVGESCRRLPEPHERRYVSVFGELLIRRFVYGTREGQKIEYVPLDHRLGLPAGEFSYVYEDWVQRLCIQNSFAEAGQSLECLLGLRSGVRTLEHMNQTLASYAESFQDQRPMPQASEEGELLVFTGDGKGVPMRRPLEDRVSGRKRRAKGEKANKKQMSYVGAVYSIDRFVRTADDVIDELRRHERRADRPQPQHKHVWTEMTETLEEVTVNGREKLFARLADEAVLRNTGGRKEIVCLLDGERALWEMYAVHFPFAMGILDIFHVLEKLWLAAHCFHPEGSDAAADFATDRLRQLLEGKVGYVIGGLRQMRTKGRLSCGKARTLQSVIGYLENNREHMRYDEYLAAGYPIGSGVAEGACRHVVKDRMEKSGMRWTLEGAQSMLDTRAIYINGDWDAFISYRIKTEQAEPYGQLAA